MVFWPWKIPSRSKLIIPSERECFALTFCWYAPSLYLQWFKSYMHLKILKFMKFSFLTLKKSFKVKFEYTIWKSISASTFLLFWPSLYFQWFKSYKHFKYLKFTIFAFLTLKNSFKVKVDYTIWKRIFSSNFFLICTMSLSPMVKEL